MIQINFKCYKCSLNPFGNNMFDNAEEIVFIIANKKKNGNSILFF